MFHVSEEGAKDILAGGEEAIQAIEVPAYASSVSSIQCLRYILMEV